MTRSIALRTEPTLVSKVMEDTSTWSPPTLEDPCTKNRNSRGLIMSEVQRSGYGLAVHQALPLVQSPGAVVTAL